MPAATLREEIKSRRSPAIDQACARNLQRLRKRMARAFRPRKPKRPSQWVRSCLRLDNTVEASSGRYDLSRRPWWHAILEALNDPEVELMAIPAGTQLGKTLALLAAILWVAENAPAPAMLVAPDKDTAIELRDRLYLNAEASLRSGRMQRIRIPPENQRNTRFIDLGSMRVYLAWSGSRQRLRGRPCRYVFLTEVDVYSRGHKTSGDPVAAAHQRIKAFFRGLLWHESSPSEHPSRITELERSATARYRWHAPCPHCGLFQELRFFLHTKGDLAGRGGIGGLKDGSGEYVSAEAGREQAHYVCEAGCRIENEDKQAMLERGRWIPFGCRLVDGQVVGPQPESRRKVGYHLWSVHSESITWGDLAGAFLEAREQGKLAEFFGNWLGLEYRPESRVPHWAQLGRRSAWTNSRRQVPPEAWFLTAGADVQGENNGLRYVVRGWAPGRTSWLVDWGWIERTAGDETALVKSDLVQLTDQVLKDPYPVVDAQGRPAENPLGRRSLPVKLLLIDSNHLPMKVHHWLRWLPESWTAVESGRVRAIRGDHQLNPETRWQLSTIDTNTRTGEQYEGGMQVWRLFVYPFYDELLQLLAGEAGRVGSWHVTADVLTQGRAYLEQVVNFGQAIQIDPKSGHRKVVWGPRNGRIPVDFWDCEIYGLVAAHMVVGDLGWSEAAWHAWREGATAGRKSASKPRSRLADGGGLDER